MLKKNVFKLCLFGLLLPVAFSHSNAQGASWPKGKPKLVVVIAIDQFRADYLSRFQSKFSKNGFNYFINNGAYFPFAEFDILQAMTCPGHATFMTGAYPYQMGIPINDWYDQSSHSKIYCVEDRDSNEVSGSKSDPSTSTKEAKNSHSEISQRNVSPKNLIGTTIGDELKNANIPSRSFSIALKDRAAVLMAGHRANLALWFNTNTHQWVSSTYYVPQGELPEWVTRLNQEINKSPSCDIKNPCGTELTMKAFKSGFENWNLGQNGTLDILTISFSTHDIAGHIYGPNSPEMETMTLAEDHAMEEIISKVKSKVPLKNVLFVLTGDHGVAPSPEYLNKTKIDHGVINEAKVIEEASDKLNKRFGKGKVNRWVKYVTDFNFYLDEEEITKAGINLGDVESEIKNALLKEPGIKYVFTAQEMSDGGQLPPGMFRRQIEKTYYKGRSGHVIGIPKPYFFNQTKNHATHMTSYTYDRTVPLIFSGFGIKSGVYSTKVEVIDIAPTLAFILGIIPPALSEGRVLGEILQK